MSRLRTGHSPADWRDLGPSVPYRGGHFGGSTQLMPVTKTVQCQVRNSVGKRCIFAKGHAAHHRMTG